jgi:hypothetical protein
MERLPFMRSLLAPLTLALSAAPTQEWVPALTDGEPGSRSSLSKSERKKRKNKNKRSRSSRRANRK